MQHAHAMPRPFGVRGAHAGWFPMAGRRHHRGRGPWGFGGPGPFGPFGFGGPGHGFGRGPRARRGDVRAALLVLLDEEPRNGYQLIQAIAERSGGVWRPSPGSVYPALQQLEDEGLVRLEESDGRRAYHLTEEGRRHVEANRETLAEPWAAVAAGVDDERLELGGLVKQVVAAAAQVALAGSKPQLAEARTILADARRALYRLLAEDEPAGDDASETGEV